MSTIRSTPGRVDRPQQPRDPFFYGWRDVITKDEHGRRLWVQQPLTREDVLHPCDGDHIVQNSDHNDDCQYLDDVLNDQVRDEPDTLVTHDLLIIWDVPELKKGHCPDITLIRGVRDLKRRFDTFNVAAEGVRPEMILEITSPSTRDVDLNEKRRQYWLAGVPLYVILDEQLRRGRRQLRIIPFRRGPRAYRRQRLDSRGWFWLETLPLWLGQEDGRAALYDLQGNRLLGYKDMTEARKKAEQTLGQEAEARKKAEQTLEQEAEARKKAEEEIIKLQAELRRLRGEE